MVGLRTVAPFLLIHLALASPLLSQEQVGPSLIAGGGATSALISPTPAAIIIPDSIRERVGYYHWKGAAIGGGVGAIAGLALAVAAGGQCDDCSTTKPSVGTVTLAGAGLGGALGFLFGLTVPRYRWVTRSPD